MCFNLTWSSSSTRKNPTNPNKHANKNLKSRIVELFLPYFVTKVFIISEAMGSFLVVSVFYSVKCPNYWTFGARYEEYVIKVYCCIKWICGARNHSLFTVTPIYPIFHPQKYFLSVVAASSDSITEGKVFDKVCISLSLGSCWVFQRPS